MSTFFSELRSFCFILINHISDYFSLCEVLYKVRTCLLSHCYYHILMLSCLVFHLSIYLKQKSTAFEVNMMELTTVTHLKWCMVSVLMSCFFSLTAFLLK